MSASSVMERRPRPASERADARIKVRGLGKAYGSLSVFQNVDLDVGKAEIVAIVGPSGCGKTTLLRCIDGLMAPTSGEITIEGERVDAPLPGVAMVFQHFGLFPWRRSIPMLHMVCGFLVHRSR
jgi:NitT/TauT family transport system ATP-binding protein